MPEKPQSDLKRISSWRGTQLVALRYKPEGSGFDLRFGCLRDFSSSYFFRPHCGSGVDPAFNGN
jgi:hypothetical protein